MTELSYARALADCVKDVLAPACERIVVAGSIRRGNSEEVKDIEILAIPKLATVTATKEDLFGKQERSEDVSVLDAFLKEKCGWNGSLIDWKYKWVGGSVITNVPEANGPKYKKLVTTIPKERGRMQVDLFLVTPETWGNQLVIRTGCAEFSEACMVALRRKGYGHKEGFVIRGEERIPCREEGEFFDLLGWKFPEPYDRTWEKAARLVPGFVPRESRVA